MEYLSSPFLIVDFIKQRFVISGNIYPLPLLLIGVDSDDRDFVLYMLVND